MHRDSPTPRPIKLPSSSRLLRLWELVRLRTHDRSQGITTKIWRWNTLWNSGASGGRRCLDDASTTEGPPRSRVLGSSAEEWACPPWPDPCESEGSAWCACLWPVPGSVHVGPFICPLGWEKQQRRLHGSEDKGADSWNVYNPHNIISSKMSSYHNGCSPCKSSWSHVVQDLLALKEVCFVVFTRGFCGFYLCHQGVLHTQWMSLSLYILGVNTWRKYLFQSPFPINVCLPATDNTACLFSYVSALSVFIIPSFFPVWS